MSQAFMREKESEWLGDVKPTLDALSRYLTRENGGVKVSLLNTTRSPAHQNREVHEMTDGSKYALDDDRRWFFV